MVEVLEPNWHVLQQRLRASSKLDELLRHHTDFLDTSLRECMLRDALLLRLLSKLLGVCVFFAHRTRQVMSEVSKVLAGPLPPSGEERREQLAERTARVESTLAAHRFHARVVEMGGTFDAHLQELLGELRKHAGRECLAHLCARLDFNNYWQGQQGRNARGASPAAPR